MDAVGGFQANDRNGGSDGESGGERGGEGGGEPSWDAVLLLDATRAAAAAEEAARQAEQRFREALDALPQGIVFLDAEGRYLHWNEEYARIYHRSADLLQRGVRLIDTLREGIARGDYPEAQGREEEWLADRVDRLEHAADRHEQWLSDGRCIMIEERKTSDGGTIGLRVDITEMKQREESFRLLFESNPVPLLVYDPADDVIVSANAAAADHFGYGLAELAGLPAERLFAAEEWNEAQRLLATSGSQKDRFWRQLRKDGQELESVLFTRQSMLDGRLATIASVFDVTERRKVEARIAHMARHDELTGLANRAHCRERLGELLNGARSGARPGGRSVTIALIDLDHFKPINDTFGHLVGDALLAEAARRMASLVPTNGLLCRIGGDEFAVIFDGQSRTTVDYVAKAIITAMKESFSVSGCLLHIGATIGMASAPDDTTSPETLLRYADLALYAAKADRRGTMRRFVRDMDVAAQQRSMLEADFRKAIRLGELEVHYQPLIDLATGEVECYEALVRWHHPVRGMVMPDAFIGLAEEIGLIDVVGQFVLQNACREAMLWPAHIKLAVNVSPIQFRSPNLLGIVVQALSSAGMDPRRLELEITEAVLMEKGPRISGMIASIRALGVGISMDDFGTGYSSLSYLLSYPFTKIKIDKSFVRGLHEEPNSQAVVRAIIGLGHSLGLTVTAEGIEDETVLDYLRGAGCAQGQGYLIGRARPASELGLVRAVARGAG